MKMKDTKNNNMLIHGFILVTILATAKSAEAEITMEAAFQGHCGHTSPCEQLCYEIHDGMYECDCIEGYELNKNGYSCQVINATANGDTHTKSDEDVLYQKGASFSAKLANNDEHDNQLNDKKSYNYKYVHAPAQAFDVNNDGISISDEAISIDSGGAERAAADGAYSSGDVADGDGDGDGENYDELARLIQVHQQKRQKVNSNDYYISDEDTFNLSNMQNDYSRPILSAANAMEATEKTTITPRQVTATGKHKELPNKARPIKMLFNGKLKQIKARSKLTDMPTTINPTPTATKAITTPTTTVTTKTTAKRISTASDEVNLNGNMQSSTNNNNNNNFEDDYYINKDMSIYDDVNNNQLNLRPLNQNTYQRRYSTDTEANSNSNTNSNFNWKLQQQSDNKIESPTISNISIVTTSNELESENCNLNCGPDGYCDNNDGTTKCRCAFGKTGNNCLEDLTVQIPKFSGKSWIAFPALRGAYKHVQLRIEFRPESFDGIILLSGERDDLTGDFLALLLNKGFVEFWFDCGSGVGSVRSRETIMLNEWNSIIVYRHRWDAWVVLNHGTKAQGRSNGLFSRITFREPVFLGGTGNITGLSKRLPITNGFVGCIRRFVANEHDYKFDEHPKGDVTKGFDIQDCVTDKCFKYPCEHGGKCLQSERGAVCLCPMGFVGDLCEIRMDLQVPAFNGSSYLRYAPLGDSALIWLELKVILKPEQKDGIILYSGPKDENDFIALSLNDGFIEFAFDLGSGQSVVRSQEPLTIGQWHVIKVSRTARLAVLKIDDLPEVMTISANGFWHLSLPHNFFVGGVSHVDKLPLDLRFKAFFVGCIQKIDINGHSLAIVSEALGGTNIGNCPHACLARPCGPLAECVPQMESYECRCNAYTAQCNKAAEISIEELEINKTRNKSKALQMKLNVHDQQQQGQNEHTTKDGGTKVKKMLKHYKEDKLHTKSYHSHKHGDKSKVRAIKGTTMQTTTTTAEPKLSTTKLNANAEIDDELIYRDDHVKSKKSNQHHHHHAHHNKDSKTHETHEKHIKSKHITGGIEKSTAGLDSAQKPYHEKYPIVGHKLSRLPAHYESFQTNPDSDILTFGDNIDWIAQIEEESNEEDVLEPDDAYENFEPREREPIKPASFTFDGAFFDDNDGTEDYQRKQLAQDMQRIMTNEHKHIKYTTTTTTTTTTTSTTTQTPDFIESSYDYFEERPMKQAEELQISEENNGDDLLEPIPTDDFSNYHELNNNQPKEKEVKESDKEASAGSEIFQHTTPQTQTDWSVLKKFELSADHQSTIGVRKNFGACFSGIDSYFHYNDAETMSQIISYNIDLNLRIKTHSSNGIILWTGRQGTTENDDDYLSLGIENGYLHFRYDLGSGEVDIKFNATKVSDGLWHRVRAIRNSQEGYLEVDSRKTTLQQSPGKLRQLNTDTGLYVGGMPDVLYFTRRKYASGIVGCISEIVLAGELKLNFDPNTLGTAHNVETGIL